MTAGTPSGWYDDPDEAGRLRLWDGERWTDEVLTRPGPTRASAPTASVVPPTSPAGQPLAGRTRWRHRIEHPPSSGLGRRAPWPIAVAVIAVVAATLVLRNRGATSSPVLTLSPQAPTTVALPVLAPGSVPPTSTTLPATTVPSTTVPATGLPATGLPATGLPMVSLPAPPVTTGRPAAAPGPLPTSAATAGTTTLPATTTTVAPTTTTLAVYQPPAAGGARVLSCTPDQPAVGQTTWTWSYYLDGGSGWKANSSASAVPDVGSSGSGHQYQETVVTSVPGFDETSVTVVDGAGSPQPVPLTQPIHVSSC